MTALLIRVVAVAGALCALLASVEANAHWDYDPWCCNSTDCKPYHGEVRITPGGYYLPEYDTTVPYKAADGTRGYAAEMGTRYQIPYQDNVQYHICVMPWEPTKVRCFYAAPGGV